MAGGLELPDWVGSLGSNTNEGGHRYDAQDARRYCRRLCRAWELVVTRVPQEALAAGRAGGLRDVRPAMRSYWRWSALQSVFINTPSYLHSM